MDVVMLSRIQYALHTCFHYLYPPISIGLGLMLVIMEGMYLWTKDVKYKEMTTFWIRIFSLTFALGVATGLVQTFSFGTNWARYSRFVGDVFGSALAAEGIFAFFLESGFLGVLLFGWDRVGPKMHYFSTVCVCLGAHFSAVWIVVANSWMQTPAGFHIVDTPLGPRAEITDFWQMALNPSTMDRLTHVILGCWLTGAFLVISVAAYYFLKRRHRAISASMMKMGLGVAIVTLLLQLWSGHSSARVVAKYQPAKLAALEGVYETTPSTPISLFGWVDGKNNHVHSLKISGGLSFLTHGNFKTPVVGLDQIPRDEWPNVPLVFQTYHIMILSWGLMFMIALSGVWYWKKGTLYKKSLLLWAMVFSVLLPHIAQQCGWISAEVGRQPWIVYKLLKTTDGVSKSIGSSQVAGSITMLLFVHILLFSLFLYLFDKKIKHGPDHIPSDQEDLVYSDSIAEGFR
jgi:cytochrome bd ubiquinol oxidase subunit I